MSNKRQVPVTPTHENELHRRMLRPQRHRLLQGYPMAPLMRTPTAQFAPLRENLLDPSRPLIIGVLPHTFCNPKIKGCGFCTFPHEKFGNEAMQRVVTSVANEIIGTMARTPVLQRRRVDAVYFGGGTANLTPPDRLASLWDTLDDNFDLRTSEVTLEGAPSYFLTRHEALLDLLARIEVRQRRISMGIQTFDRDWLVQMGRDAFGDHDTFRRVVEAAHRRGFSASADLLFNLPGATLERALLDVRTAVDLGFDQICAYNLVLNSELDTEWAKSSALVTFMPNADKARTTWLAVRETLLENGYVQTTLTNFERADIVQTERRFLYEPASFNPAVYDAIGFGPGGISTFTNRGRAVKWMNVSSSEQFVEHLANDQSVVASYFAYGQEDLKLLHLTRNLAQLSIDCTAYEKFFGTTPQLDFASPFEALERARLIHVSHARVELTPEGMFYADAVVGLLAHDRVQALRTDVHEPVSHRGHMG